MNVKLYDTVKGFLFENEDILIENEAINQLILINAYNNRDEYTNIDLIFGRVEDDKHNVNLIFVNPKPYNLLIYYVDGELSEAVNTLANYIVENGISINGINSSKKICSIFIQHYAEITDCIFEKRLSMDIMTLTELNRDIALPKGNYRQATWDDKEILSKWYIEFSEEALKEQVKYEEFGDKLKREVDDGCYYIFEDENHRPVSMAKCARQLKSGVSLSFVYSSREVRDKGYGIAIVYNITKDYLGRGNKYCTLFVDKTNPVSNRIYKKIGYEIVEDNYDFRIRR